MNLYWADFHKHVNTPEDTQITLAEARRNIDVYPALLYPFEWKIVNGLRMETCRPSAEHERIWREIVPIVAQHHEPGRFIALPAFEWHGNRQRHGDYNVFYFGDVPGELVYPDTLTGLYEHLRAVGGVAIPHHIAYAPGRAGTNYAELDPALSPVIDLFSVHGSSEADGRGDLLPHNPAMGPGVGGTTAQDALNRGLHVGLIASNDGEGLPGGWGRGLTAIWAEDLTTEAVLAALKARRVYGVTGDRIRMTFDAAGQPMGSAIDADGPVEFSCDIQGAAAIDRIELVRNGVVVQSYCHSGAWEGRKYSDGVRAKCRFTLGWGPRRWVSEAVTRQRWRAALRVDGARIVDVEPCFTRFGNRVESWDASSCVCELTTDSTDTFQSIVVELDGDANATIELKVDGVAFRYRLDELMKRSRVDAMLDETRDMLKRRFGLEAGDLFDDDPLWHHARKVKAELAVPAAAYEVRRSMVDEPRKGRESYYYLRVTQMNGQMAWSSPIWVRH